MFSSVRSRYFVDKKTRCSQSLRRNETRRIRDKAQKSAASCGFTPFQDVLFAGLSGLNHLIDRAITSGEILVGKAKGDVVDDFGFLEGQQCLIVASRGNDGARREEEWGE